MKREAVERKTNLVAKKETKKSAPKVLPGKAKTVAEKAAKPQKPQTKTKEAKNAKIVADKTVKEPKETKPKAAKPKATAVSKSAKQTPTKVSSPRTSKPKTNAKTSKEPSVKPKAKKQTDLVMAKNKKPAAKKIKTAVSSQKSKPQTKKVISNVSLKKTKVSPKTVDLPKAVAEKPPRKKPVKPLGTAVFRGKKGHYDFKVFPINEIFETAKGVYIISKRITDRQKRAHHKLVCIGQTDSIFEEIKKHRKSRCLHQNQANVISILPEESEAKRLQIETDLKAAHSISCNLP